MPVFRPLLPALNYAANALVRKVGVEPADQLAVGPSLDALRHLVEHSVNVAALDASFFEQIRPAKSVLPTWEMGSRAQQRPPGCRYVVTL